MPKKAEKGKQEVMASFPPSMLPQQEKFFATAGLKRSARSGTQLPDPTHAPYGYDPSSQFRHLFPALELPILKPPASHHPEDHMSFGSPALPPHELFLGDNLYLLRQMPSEMVDLIYIDPPFFSNRTYTQIWGDDNEVRSFNDIFQDGMFSYLAWLNARLLEMKRVLKSTGSIYVHCDWHASHYIKCEMDKIFGYNNLRNEIVWCYRGGGVPENDFAKKHDIIFRYSKTGRYYFNVDSVRIAYSDDVLKSDPSRYEKSYRDSGVYSGYAPNPLGKHPEDWWEVQPIMPSDEIERIGYPTQKPIELLQRIIDSSCPPSGTVADFFMGGGTTGVVALGVRIKREKQIINRRDGTKEEKEKRTIIFAGGSKRFIGCDISRVAVSVSASRLVEVGEEISGIVVSSKKIANLGLKLKPFADIQIGYVGSYPVEKFKGISHEEFVKFVLGLYQASVFTGKAQYIHGLANGKLVICVGPADPNEKVSLTQVKGFVEETLRQYQTQLAKGEEKILQVIGWGFDPEIEPWKGQAITVLNKQNFKMQVDLVSLSSESFRQKIFRHVGESNIDLKFNRLNQLLSFTASPYAGKIQVIRQDGFKFEFRLEGAKAIGTGRLINTQWDFSYDGARFASREHALNREKRGQGDFEAVFEVGHEFPGEGIYTVAAKVQDNLDGEATTTTRISISSRGYKFEE